MELLEPRLALSATDWPMPDSGRSAGEGEVSDYWSADDSTVSGSTVSGPGLVHARRYGIDWYGEEILVKLKDPIASQASESGASILVGPFRSVPQSQPPEGLIPVLIASGATGSRSAFQAIQNDLAEVNASLMPLEPGPRSEYEHARGELARWHRLEMHANDDIEAKLEVIRRLPGVEYAELNYGWKPLYEIPPVIDGLPDGSTDPAYDSQWYLNATRTWKAWDHLKKNGVNPGGERTVVVAVIDTGVDYTHEDLVGNMWVNADEIAGNGIDDDKNGYVDDIHGASTLSTKSAHTGDPADLHGHGTHVAGIIGAQAFNKKGGVGVAFNTQIMAVRAGQASGVFTIDDVAEAILYAADNGADVINMSFGGYQRSQIVADALSVALNQAVLVAAAGNEGLPIQKAPLYPAALSYVLGVEASTPSGDLADFSNSGYDVRAPGTSIYSTLPRSNNYASWSGTSMAAPVVSGIAALMRSYFWQREIYSNRFIMGSIAASGNVVDAYKALTEPPQPGVALDTNWLFDGTDIAPGNDGDGRADAGETLRIGIEVVNRSGFAENVVAKLKAQAPGAVLPDPYVTFTTDTVQLGSIGPFALKNNSILYNSAGAVIGVGQPFVFTVSPNAPNDHVIHFQITFTFDDGWNPERPPLTRIDDFRYIVQRGKDVPRVISQDMDLTADHLWIIGSPVLIESQATVRVMPGTEVQWGAVSSDPYNPGPQSGSLIVRGKFIVQGTAADPVNLFPSYLVSGQRTSITVDTGGRAELRYAKIRNPNLNSVARGDHLYFDWDAYDIRIGISEISNSHFNRLRGAGSIAFDIMDTSLFSAGRVNPPDSRIYNSVFLQDNETNQRLTLTKTNSFSDRLTNEVGDLTMFHGVQVLSNGDTYVTLPMERASLEIAQSIASFYGGNVASAATSADWEILKAYLQTAPSFRSGGSANVDQYFIGLSDRQRPNEWKWIDGATFNFNQWAADQPTLLPGEPMLSRRAVRALMVTNNGSTKDFGWRVLSEPVSSRFGNGTRQNWNSFILRLPGSKTLAELDALAAGGRLLEHVKQTLPQEVRYNAFLSKTWDPTISRWMRVQTSGPSDGHTPLRDNFWGTSNTQLIDYMIYDFQDTFTTPKAYYQPAPSAGASTTWPFVQGVAINGVSTQGVPQIGAGPTEFTVTFNRDMAPDVQPFVTFGPAAPFTDYLVAPPGSGGGWVTPRVWKGTFWVTPMTGEGFHQMRISDAVAADDPWLVSGYDVGRFRFEVKTMGVAGMTLAASGQEGHIRLNWNQDDFELLAGYHLYRSSTADGTYQRITSTVLPPQTTTFVDWNVQPAQTFYYKFTVVKTDMTESAFSNVASATAVDTIVPQITHAPKNSAQPATGFAVRASITDNVRVESAAVHYRPRGSSASFTPLPMYVVSGNDWMATVPGVAMQSPGIEYYLTATDGVSHVYHGTAAAPHLVVVEDKPTLMTISPNRGTAQGGTSVILSGAMFRNGARVWFGQDEATDVVVASATQINAKAPAHFPSRVDVRVVNPDGGEATKLSGYEFVHEGSVVSMPIVTADRGAVVEIPVSLSDVSGFLSASLRIGFQSSVISLQSVSTGTLTSGWGLQTNTSTANQVTLAMASGMPISGNGTIAKLTFSVVGAIASQSPLTLTQISFNDGAITASPSDGLFVVNGSFDLSGAVKYFLDQRPITNVDMRLIGVGEQGRVTNSQGQFAFGNIVTGAYTLRPSKSSDVTDITAHDASLVLKRVAGLQTLSSSQLIAADVNKSGTVTALDAAYILQKSVGLISGTFPGAGKAWEFLPEERAYPLFSGTLQGQDFSAVLIGDVSGNWNSGSGAMGSGATGSGTGQGFAIGAWGVQGLATLSLANAVGNIGTTVNMPLRLSRNGTQPTSLDLRIDYDPSRLRFVGITSDSVWSSAYRLATPGEVLVAMAGAEAPVDADVLLTARFEIMADVRTPTRVTLAQAVMDEGMVGTVLESGWVGAIDPPPVGMSVVRTTTRSPELRGTVDDHMATVEVVINGKTHSAINQGDGTWKLTSGTIDPPLADGAYDVTIRATDSLSRTGTAVVDDGIVVDQLAPRVSGAYVRGSTWASGFSQLLQSGGLGNTFGGFRLADGTKQLATASNVTWQLINQISVGFDEAVVVDPTALRLFGNADQSFALAEGGFAYDPLSRIARWTLAEPLPLGKFLISLDAAKIVDQVGNRIDGEWTTSQTTYGSGGNGAAGGDFNFRFNFLPGDANLNGQTNLADSNLIRAMGTRLTDLTNFRMDVNGSNQVNLADSNIIRAMGTRTLIGVAEPTNPPASFAATGTGGYLIGSGEQGFGAAAGVSEPAPQGLLAAMGSPPVGTMGSPPVGTMGSPPVGTMGSPPVPGSTPSQPDERRDRVPQFGPTVVPTPLPQLPAVGAIDRKGIEAVDFVFRQLAEFEKRPMSEAIDPSFVGPVLTPSPIRGGLS